MPRFFLPPESWSGAALTGDEARHLSQVLRIKPGEKIVVFDGHGRRAEAEVLNVSRDRTDLRIGDVLPPRRTGPSVTLVQSIPKGKNMDLIVQKAVELGVAAIQPLVTKNTIVQPGEGKSDKWRRTALEACKQCGQDTLPEITDPLSFSEWISGTSPGGLKLIASLRDSARPLRQILRDHPSPSSIHILVGPEGDFTPAETDAALSTGYLPVNLGDIVLRVETASIFCLSALSYEYQFSDP